MLGSGSGSACVVDGEADAGGCGGTDGGDGGMEGGEDIDGMISSELGTAARSSTIDTSTLGSDTENDDDGGWTIEEAEYSVST